MGFSAIFAVHDAMKKTLYLKYSLNVARESKSFPEPKKSNICRSSVFLFHHQYNNVKSSY